MKLLYNGISMNPLFREGDVLEVIPYHGQEIRVGDVVAFSSPEKHEKVIHRVVTVRPSGILTKGDNCSARDNWNLKPGEIIGKVVTIYRYGRTLPVSNHAPASLYILKGRQLVDQALSRLLQPVYHRLARSGLFQSLLGGWMQPQLLYFSRSEGPEWQLWMGNLLIGRKLPHQAYWNIRRPFRLFVDETTLPN